MIERVAILGVGLIGGSLALAWKEAREELTVIGHDRAEVMVEALARGVIDEAESTAAAAVERADLVVLATPLAPMLGLLEEIAPHLAPGVPVTDVGSVKRAVVQHAADVLPAANLFVGGHPMAGSEQGGVRHADPFLFQNATYVLCPPPDVDEQALLDAHPDLVSLVEATGARVRVMEASRHDRIAAAVSHVPQLLAVALAGMAGDLHEQDDALLSLAAGGFRDMTRIAASPFPMWRDILAANHGAILDTLGTLATRLQQLRGRLAEEDFEALEDAFARGRTTRAQIPKDTKGFLHPLADLYVQAEDRPGALLDIVKTVYEGGLDLKDMELLHVREGTGGVFRLGFVNDAAAREAETVLQEAGIEAHRLQP